ncbi:hypothetical protein [Amycolatopsis speibonae]|uniref:DUF1963 domain-containing protein n=1 Tax=Amycolatopsis speibonae TaxID=1450224 RepID=A0ABV7P4L1_9PSEU
MKFTTPGKPVDVATVFPELAGSARTTVRLHPWRGVATARESSLGGPLLWPADEAWPMCTIDHPDPRPLTSAEGQELERRRNELHDAMNALARAGDHATVGAFYREYEALEADIRKARREEYADDPAATLPMVPIAQFYRRDLPELPFPDGTDVCQVLWCPTDHEPHYGPLPQVWWRDAAKVTEVATAPDPDRLLSDDGSLPVPCRISPERVVEFPGWEDLPSDDLRERLETWEKGQEWRYGRHLSVAPGTKVGGWVSWIQSPVRPECDRDHRMDHLLTVASSECGSDAWQAWMPVETQARTTFARRVRFAMVDGSTSHTTIGEDEKFDPAAWTMFGKAVVPESVVESTIPLDDDEPEGLGLMLGDIGDLYLFVCATCAERPIAVEFQCT